MTATAANSVFPVISNIFQNSPNSFLHRRSANDKRIYRSCKGRDDMSSRQWGGVLAGHPFDLQDWTEALPSPHEPWVERWDIGGVQRVLLRSTGFQRLEDSTAVWEATKLLTNRLNGAFATHRRAEPLTVEGVAERRPDGTIGQHVIMAVGAAHARARAGSLSAPQVGPTEVQRWLQMADQNELVEDLLIHQSAPANWYDLYKSYEVIRRLCGGQRKLLKRSWSPPADTLSNFTHTVNSYRHSRAHSSREELPKDPMPFDEAKEMIRTMADKLLQELPQQPS